MSLAALSIVILAAICHSTWNLVVKSVPDRDDLINHGIIVVLALLLPWVLSQPLHEIPAEGWAFLFATSILHALYFIALQTAYRIGDLSLIYPIARGTAPLLVMPAAAIALHEVPSPLGVIGVFLVLIGALTVSLLPAWFIGRGGTAGILPRAAVGRSVAIALILALITAAYSLVDKRGIQLVPPVVYLFFAFVGAVAFHLLRIWAIGRRLRWDYGFSWWLRASIVGILSFASYLLILFAFALAPVSYVVAGREISIIFSTIMGIQLLKEQGGLVRISGSMIIFCGLACIGFAG
jgi:drug/metabolite transporter (DMT)-like permease